MPETTSIFKTPFALQPGETQHLKFGQLRYWILKHSKEYHLHWKYGKLASAPRLEKTALPEGDMAEIYKWIHGDTAEGFYFSPALPDKSIVVRSQHPLKIPAQISCLFYLHIPTFLQVVRDTSGGGVIFEKSSAETSLTWFGDMANGSLCYTQHSAFYQELNNLPSKYYHAICPIRVNNKSDQDLEFECFCLEAKRLTLYSGKENFWTNNVSVSYEGADKASQIEIARTPPAQEPKAPVIAKPRETGDEGKLWSTFDRIKKFTGI